MMNDHSYCFLISGAILMKKYSVYGSCQAEALAVILNSNPTFKLEYEYVPIKAAFMIKAEEINTLHEILRDLDLFIYQPIISYDERLTTKYLTKNILKEQCVKIIYPYMHFTGYHPQIVYIKNPNGPGNLSGFSEYHDINLIEWFLFKKTENVFDLIQNIRNPNFYDKNFLLKCVKINIDNFKKREKDDQQGYYITISDFVQNNYTKKRLFHTINHPSKYLFHYLVEQIFNYLKIAVIFDDSIDKLSKGDIFPIYKSVINNLELGFNNVDVVDNYIRFSKSIDINEVFGKDVNAYKVFRDQEKNFAALKNSIVNWIKNNPGHSMISQ